MEWTNYVIGGRERAKDFKHAARRGADGSYLPLQGLYPRPARDFLTKPLSEPAHLRNLHGLLRL